MIKKIIVASLVLALVVGYFSYNPWEFELTNNSTQTWYYSLSDKLKDLEPLKPNSTIHHKSMHFTYQPHKAHSVIIADKLWQPGQPEPVHTKHEFTAKSIKATIDKNGAFVINEALPAKQLLSLPKV